MASINSCAAKEERAHRSDETAELKTPRCQVHGIMKPKLVRKRKKKIYNTSYRTKINAYAFCS